MVDLQTVTKFMLDNFQNVTVQKNGIHFHARCRLCGDSQKNSRKKRFHLEFNNGLVKWHCFNCGKSSKDFSFIKLYSIVTGLSEEQVRQKLYNYQPDKLKDRIKHLRTELPIQAEETSDIYFNDILHDCISETGHVDSMLEHVWKDTLKTFREERMIPDKYKLFYAYKGKYQNRIIIPVYDGQENIIYFQARRVPGTDIEPKYKNPASLKEMIIHNHDAFDVNKPIIVTEGLIDAFMIGNQGTTCLGKEVGDEFLKKLFKLTKKDIILAYDNDEPGQKSLKNFVETQRLDKNRQWRERVKYFIMPEDLKHCKDINICKVEEDIDDIYKFIIKNTVNWRVLKKEWMMKKGGGT